MGVKICIFNNLMVYYSLIEPTLTLLFILKYMSRFARLLEYSKEALQDSNSFVNKFAYPGLFVNSLNELNELIGNDAIKESLASQIMYLVSIDTENKDVNAQPMMINTLLYGPSGAGKTAVAMKIAKIWYAMGIIGQKESIFSYGKSFVESIMDEQPVILMTYAYMGFVMSMSIYSFVKKSINDTSTFWIILGIVGFILIVYSIHRYYINQYNESTIKDTDIVTIVSREDFVDKYLGGTDKKTKDLLMRNTGKVLFIDEAYSLYNGDNDPYGMEALTTLNRYISENPEKIVVIMAGYKDLIRDKIFANQPGLRSRFMWHFECNGYNANELYQIFLVMLKKEGWSIIPEHKRSLQDLITKNYESFKAFGRDIQRLVFFSQLEHSEMSLNDVTIQPRELNITMIERGMRTYLQNDVDESTQSTTSLADLLKSMMKDQKQPERDSYRENSVDDMSCKLLHE